MADDFGLKIGLEGEKEFKKALSEINQSFKVLGSEMKLVSSQFDKNDQSVEALTARNTVLNKEIEAQKQKIETLKKALENAATSFGENDRRTQAWQIQLNNAEAALNDMERELQQNNDALDRAAGEFDDAEKQADDFGDEVEDAGKQSDDAGGKFEKLGAVCKAAGVAIAAAFAAVSAAAVAAGKALVDMAVEGAAYADTVLTESTVTGIATDKLQEYMYAAELVDVSTETLTKSMAKQIKSMKSATDGSKTMVAAYDALGVSVTDANGNMRDSDTVYWELIDALGKVENETERDALAMTILGKSAQELNPLIEAGAQRMQELGEEARNAGYVLSEDMLAAYGALDDNLQYLKVNAEGAKNALGTVLLPVLTELSGTGVELLAEFTKGISDANGDIGKMSDVIGEILPKALDAVMEYVPELLEVIASIVGSLGQAIIDNLPVIVESASQIILSILNGLIAGLPQITNGALQLVLALVSGILSNLPMLIETAAQVIVTIATGLATALPTLIPTLVEVVVQMCQTLVDNLPLILDAALQLITGLAQGILEALPVVIEALPQIIDGIVTFFLDSIPQIIDTGIQLLTSLVEALPQIITAIVAAIPKIIDNIISAVLSAIPQIIQAGIDLLIALVRALPQIITTIVQAIPQIISGIVNALIGNIDKIILAGVQLFVALIENLPTIIVEIVKAVPQIIAGIVSAFGSLMYKIVEIGGNIVKGLWQGIQQLASWLWDKVSGWISSIWDGICDFFGIHSPSDEMAWVGEMLVKGLAGSIDRNGGEAVKAAEAMSADINDVMHGLAADMSTALPASFSVDGSVTANGVNGVSAAAGQTVINIYPQTLDEATIDYLFVRFNARLGAAI
ncbi:MAG: phage tail protein [Faecousia sp.]